MEFIKTYNEFLIESSTANNSIYESSTTIISENGLGFLVSYNTDNGNEEEFKITTPSGLVKIFYGNEFHRLTSTADEICKLKKFSTDILTNISTANNQYRFDIIISASKRDLFQSDNGFFDDLEEDFLSKDPNISRKELKEFISSARFYLSGEKSQDEIPTISSYFDEYLDDILYYIVGKISGFLWWLKTNLKTYNGLSAQSLFSIYNKKILYAARSTNWNIQEPIDAESERSVIPGKTVYVLWPLTKQHQYRNEQFYKLHVGAIIDPYELSEMEARDGASLMVSLFDDNGQAIAGFHDIRLNDLKDVLRVLPKRDAEYATIEEQYVYHLFDDVRLDEGIISGIKSVAGKILGFLTGKNKKIKELGSKYLSALISKIDDTIELEAKMHKIEIQLGTTRASKESIKYKELKTKLGNSRSSHTRKINTIEHQLNDIAIKNNSLKSQIDKVKQEAEKYADQHKNTKLKEIESNR